MEEKTKRSIEEGSVEFDTALSQWLDQAGALGVGIAAAIRQERGEEDAGLLTAVLVLQCAGLMGVHFGKAQSDEIAEDGALMASLAHDARDSTTKLVAALCRAWWDRKGYFPDMPRLEVRLKGGAE